MNVRLCKVEAQLLLRKCIPPVALVLIARENSFSREFDAPWISHNVTRASHQGEL